MLIGAFDKKIILDKLLGAFPPATSTSTIKKVFIIEGEINWRPIEKINQQLGINQILPLVLLQKDLKIDLENYGDSVNDAKIRLKQVVKNY